MPQTRSISPERTRLAKVLFLAVLLPLLSGAAFPTEAQVTGEGEPIRPVILDSLHVRVTPTARDRTLEAQGFYRRSATGNGTFFDRPAIDSLRPHGVDDLLRRIPAVRFRYDDLGRRFPYLRDALPPDAEPCYPLVFVDGLQIQGAGGFVEGLVSHHDLAGMEVYAGSATVPARFARRGHRCGVIVFWTRIRE